MTNYKTILRTAFGACLEWYEFSLFMFVTPMISNAFFPGDNRMVALLSTFGIFAAGYLMRPIGGIYFGNLGDRWGRRKVLILTTGLMMIPMLGIALLPAYATWGITSVILLLLFRMIQGVSVGGEYTSVLTMLLEQAPKSRRALITSSASVVSGIGILISSVVVVVLTAHLGEHAMYAWGWRVPFGIGFLLAAFAFYSQLQLDESPQFEKMVKKKRVINIPVLSALKEHPREIFYVFLLAGFLGIPCYLGQAFFPNYLITVMHLPKAHVMEATMWCNVIYLPFIPLSAWLADIYGRKPILLITTFLFIVVAYPAYMLINSGSLDKALIGNAILLILYGCEVAVFVTIINEFFPTQERISGVSTGYNVGNAIFGGTTPLFVTYLIARTHNHFAPAWYLIIAAAVTLFFVFTMKETKNNATL
jgi:MFS transporter, MHS family, proline/betaine transporter